MTRLQGNPPTPSQRMANTPDPSAAAAVRVRLDLGYDGARFSGWARQPGRRTVQGTIEEALSRLLRLPEPPRLTVAGRTDAGVHARGQVAHFDVATQTWAQVADRAAWRLVGLLPADIRVHAACTVPDGFDARFSAVWRRYSYRVCDDPLGMDPLCRHETLVHERRLELTRMNAAALALVGEHDFAAYCRRHEGATTIRQLIRLDWARNPQSLAVATVVANAFCHNMVRALVGALLAVGDGRKPTSWPAEVLSKAARDPAVQVAPPYGLCLEEVRYPRDDELAEDLARGRGSITPPAVPS